MAFLLGCASPPSADEAKIAKSASSDSKSPAPSANAATRMATLDHGDKPGNGYELIVRHGAVTSGKFYLLDPNKPHDLKSAGQIAAFENLKTEGREITFSITLKTGNGEHRETMTMTLDDPLTGKPGARVNATVKSHAANAASQELTFVRRE
jgi:hypothetical protein